MRKTLRIILYVLSIVAICFFLAAIVTIIVLLIKTNNDTYSDVSDYWQMAYYLFSILGGVGALLAVIVALFKDSILGWMNRPDLEINTNGVKFTRNQNNTLIDEYTSDVVIKNRGLAGAFVCQLVIVAFKYNEDRKKEMLHDISRFSEKTVKVDGKDSFTISNKPVSIRIIQLSNPQINGTPEGGNDSCPILNILDLKESADLFKRGMYEIEYEIRSDKEVLSSFSIFVDWVGDWSDDPQKMIDDKKLEIKKI